MLPYAASKAGVIKLTESQAAEWGHLGIRVNCIAPGPVTTEGAAERIWPNEKVKAAMLLSRALQRFGTCEEIAYPCIFLASDAASFITGALLIADGGNLRYGDALTGSARVTVVARASAGRVRGGACRERGAPWYPKSRGRIRAAAERIGETWISDSAKSRRCCARARGRCSSANVPRRTCAR